MFSLIPVAHYNNLYELFYTLEVISVSHIMTSYVVYETLLITFCWMISAQLKTVASKYSAFGHDTSLTTDTQDNEPTETDKLVKIISDHQRVIKVMNTFYDIAKPLSIIQIGINAIIFIICTYMIVLNYFDGSPVLSIASIKWMSSALIIMFHLFTYCYFFGYLDDQKKSINFSLYSSNWFQEDIGFKKLVLLAMTMNNAINNTSIKLSPIKIVNLELFSSVMHTSYSIVSVFAKKSR
ncbi:odorant receptor 33a-like isoform X2 [Adelges cooleyi]|nr:odorant receptor 33a-like isoform X2 [Adelges cooleyi]